MWETEMVTMLRHMIGDLDAPLKYSDSRLQEAIIVAAQLVKSVNGVTFVSTYTTDVDSLTLSPDPTETSIRDDAFINLTTMKAACMTDFGVARASGARSISFREGPSSVDLRGPMQTALAIVKDKGGWCNVFLETLFDYRQFQTTEICHAIMGPFREYSRRGGDVIEFR